MADHEMSTVTLHDVEVVAARVIETEYMDHYARVF